MSPSRLIDDEIISKVFKNYRFHLILSGYWFVRTGTTKYEF